MSLRSLNLLVLVGMFLAPLLIPNSFRAITGFRSAP